MKNSFSVPINLASGRRYGRRSSALCVPESRASVCATTPQLINRFEYKSNVFVYATVYLGPIDRF